jgi:hypothetical protein
MSSMMDATSLVSLTGDQNASTFNVSCFRMSESGRVLIHNTTFRLVAAGSATDSCLTVVVLLEWSCDLPPPSKYVTFEAIEFIKFVCSLLRLCILGRSPRVPGLDMIHTAIPDELLAFSKPFYLENCVLIECFNVLHGKKVLELNCLKGKLVNKWLFAWYWFQVSKGYCYRYLQ